MIFQHTWKSVLGLDGEPKTVTRRLVKDDQNDYEILDMPSFTVPEYARVIQFSPGYPRGRIKWEVGKTYSVQPGRGKPALYVCWDHPCFGVDVWQDIKPGDIKAATSQGYQEARIKLLRINRERLQDITPEDCYKEGVAVYTGDTLIPPYGNGSVSDKIYIDTYARRLWDEIHTRKGERFLDNPPVWRLQFELVRGETR